RDRDRGEAIGARHRALDPRRAPQPRQIPPRLSDRTASGDNPAAYASLPRFAGEGWGAGPSRLARRHAARRPSPANWRLWSVVRRPPFPLLFHTQLLPYASPQVITTSTPARLFPACD